MKMSSDTRKAISVILFYIALLFFLIGIAARLKMDFHSRLEICTPGLAVRRSGSAPWPGVQAQIRVHAMHRPRRGRVELVPQQCRRGRSHPRLQVSLGFVSYFF